MNLGTRAWSSSGWGLGVYSNFGTSVTESEDHIQTRETGSPAGELSARVYEHHDRVTGVDIRVDRMGSGEPIVVLNGLLGLNEHWFPCMSHLLGKHVPFDAEILLLQPPLLEMRGSGCSVHGVSQLLMSLLSTLVERPAVLIGNSFGGHVALRIAMARPELVRGLVLVGSSGLFERGFEKDITHNPSYEYLDRKIREVFYDPSSMLPGMTELALDALSRRTSARAMVKLGKSAKRDHLGSELHRVKCPTLVAWGRQDNVTPPEVAEQFADLIPKSRLRWTDQCGHAPHIEHPAKLAADIQEFVSDVLTGRFVADRHAGNMKSMGQGVA